MTLLPTSFVEFFPVTYKAQSPPLPSLWPHPQGGIGGLGQQHNQGGLGVRMHAWWSWTCCWLTVTKGNSPVIPAHRRGLLSEVMCACEHLSSEHRLAVESPQQGSRPAVQTPFSFLFCVSTFGRVSFLRSCSLSTGTCFSLHMLCQCWHLTSSGLWNQSGLIIHSLPCLDWICGAEAKSSGSSRYV